MESWSLAATSRPPAERSRLRTLRSPARKSIRSPARAARAASSNAASIAESSRGTSSTRPADVREVSRTRTTRRSRSGCQVRTTTLRLRALALQSMDRTSSPRTYSRNESNSVPWPRTRTADRPSRSRSRASRLGRCLRDSKGGSDRTAPATLRVAWREARPSGPGRRTVTPIARRSPRRRGRSGVRRLARSPGPSRIRCRLSVAPAVGCQESRTSPLTRRPPSLLATNTVSVGWPSRIVPTGRRTMDRMVGRGATAQSTRVTRVTASTHSQTVLRAGRSTTGTSPRRSRSGTRPEIAISGDASSWDRDRSQRRGQDLGHVDAFELGLGTQSESMHQCGVGECLHVVGRHEVPALQPGPGPC